MIIVHRIIMNKINYLFLVSIVFVFSSCVVFRSTDTHTHAEKAEKTNEKVIAKTTTKATRPSAKAEKKIEGMIATAQSYKGVPYKIGGQDEGGMDCSGLIYKVSAKAGIPMPRNSYEQATYGQLVQIEQIQKGDLVFFATNKNSKTINHVGMVTEVDLPNKVSFIHSSTTKGVIEDNLFSKYWKNYFIKAKRPFVF